MLRDAIRAVHAGNAVLARQDLATLLDGEFRSRTPPDAFPSLTDKEREVFTAVARGLSNTEIARLIFASQLTSAARTLRVSGDDSGDTIRTTTDTVRPPDEP